MKIPPQILGYLVGLLLIGIVIYMTMKKLGLTPTKKTKEDKDLEKQIGEERNRLLSAEKSIRNNVYFRPDKWSQAPQSKLITDSQATEYANKLKKALNSYWWLKPGTWGDDEQAVYNVMRRIPNLWNLSQISDKYSALSGNDLASQIINDFDTSEMAEVVTILDSKST